LERDYTIVFEQIRDSLRGIECVLVKTQPSKLYNILTTVVLIITSFGIFNAIDILLGWLK
jgi:hypothetical protein